MTVVPIAEAKARLSELVGRVHDHHERVTVTVHGRPSVVLVAIEDLEALEETLEVLADSEAMRRLAESDAEIARGELLDEDDIAAAIATRRRDLA